MLTDEALKQRVRNFYSRVQAGIPGFKARYGQREMIAGIANTLARTRQKEDEPADGQNIVVVEGKTGVGKTIGYLIPALVMAKAMGKKLVVSTGTVSLQEQLYERDLPALTKHFGEKIEYALAKGRGRYLCPARLNQVAGNAGQDGLFDDEPSTGVWERKPEEKEIKFLRKLVKEFDEKRWSGDRDMFPETIPQDLWSRVTTDSGGCSGRRCPHVTECPYFKARATILSADVIVANHDLVLSCLASDSPLLPAPSEVIFIFDEAHHLPDVAVARFATHAPLQGSIRWLERLPGFLARVMTSMPAKRNVNGVGETIKALETKLKELQSALRASNLFGEKKIYRFPNGELQDDMLVIAGELASLTQDTGRLVEKIRGGLEDAIEAGEISAVTAEPLIRDFGGYSGKLSALIDVWQLMIRERPENGPPLAKWLELAADGKDIIVHASPITASGVLRKHLWSSAAAVVLASATVTTLGDFRFYLKKTGLAHLPKVSTLSVQSPFDYATQGQLAVPRMRFDPKEVEGHTQEIGQLLPELLESWRRGSLVLFSSKRQMEAVHGMIPDHLKADVLMQGTMSRPDLIESHKRRVESGARSILFGLAGLGEGLDLPGALCEHVVIAKIPFPPPDSPLEEALAEWVEKNKGNPFSELTLPKAGLILIQWVGRLIRTEEDRGRITIFDRRLTTKTYGARLLKSLPEFSRV